MYVYIYIYTYAYTYSFVCPKTSSPAGFTLAFAFPMFYFSLLRSCPQAPKHLSTQAPQPPWLADRQAPRALRPHPSLAPAVWRFLAPDL